MGLANRFFSSSESFDASATMANISYASTAPTVGQANSPVSLILITLYIDLHFPLPPNITSLPRSFIPLSIVISYLGSGPVARFSRLSLPLIYATGGYRHRVISNSLGLGTTRSVRLCNRQSLSMPIKSLSPILSSALSYHLLPTPPLLILSRHGDHID